MRFEDVFGRRLPIWAGGITLAVAGFLIVRYSIEAGLLSPAVRAVLGLVFGGGLIAGAEGAHRRPRSVADPRVAQALAGAGIATLYGTVLAAANLYHLVGPSTAFIGLAALTVLAGLLSIRFGAPSAVLGLVGGLAAPALVGASQPDVPLLTLYLALAVGGLCALGRRQRWAWLGAAALAGGFGWGAILIVGSAPGSADGLSVGLYMLALGVGLPMLAAGDRAATVRLAAAAMGCAQIAALVAVGGFAPLHWGLFGLISIAILWLSRRERLFADVPALTLGTALLLAFAWPHPAMLELSVVIAAIVAIFAVPAALRVWRAGTRPIDAPSVAAASLAAGALPAFHVPGSALSIGALIGAAITAGVATLGWRVPSRRDDARFATLLITATALLALATAQALPDWTFAPVAALLTLGLLMLEGRAGDRRVGYGGRAFGVLAIVLLAGDPGVFRLFGIGPRGDATAVATWLIPAAIAGSIGWRLAPRLAVVALPAAVLAAYGAAAQIVASYWLPLIPAALALALAMSRDARALPGAAAAGALMIGWAVEPFLHWLVQAADATAGIFVSLRGWPTPEIAAIRIALPASALFVVAALLPLRPRVRAGARAIAAAAIVVAAHVGWTHLFAIDGHVGFIERALAERTLWETGLAAVALIAWRVGSRRASIAFGIASLVHFGWFTGLVLNPLWVNQHVGPWAVIAYSTAGVLASLAPCALPALERQRDWLLMALAVLGSSTLLRQAMHAPIVLDAGTGDGEQIARSLLALALGGCFLWAGIVRRALDWRIASLALMLVAVAKAFLFDAAGLDGLARIASFAALGFSLIGVGWLHSRYLPEETP